MFIAICFVTFIVLYLIFLMIAEKLKNIDRNSNMLLGMETSILGVSIIAISSPNTSDNLFYMWSG